MIAPFILVLASALNVPPQESPESLPPVVETEVPGLFKARFSWSRKKKKPLPGKPDEFIVLPGGLRSRLVLREGVDRERLSIRINDVEMRDVFLSPNAGEMDSPVRLIHVDALDEQAEVEIEVYALGEAEPVLDRTFLTAPYRPRFLGRRGAVGSHAGMRSAVFPLDDIPDERREKGPPEYRRR